VKKIIFLLAAVVISFGANASGRGHSTATGKVTSGHVNPSSHAVSAHTTKNGTYVASSHATNPNRTKTDNYSQKGNVNPYNGKKGTKN
jgi:hypothetical protein